MISLIFNSKPEFVTLLSIPYYVVNNIPQANGGHEVHKEKYLFPQKSPGLRLTYGMCHSRNFSKENLSKKQRMQFLQPGLPHDLIHTLRSKNTHKRIF
ncbi:hypothetical protein Aconfl_33190 [Algoriphagus confluentis]|uniref:Uncharacterized protein n=1 Tax=Algoriphagus confluentis TaxID=1697556 RepID=A0ABQ6PSR3_9BACT|nr:hypothetical protein Aconfl_33190 [Algoriphagus confluentis]